MNINQYRTKLEKGLSTYERGPLTGMFFAGKMVAEMMTMKGYTEKVDACTDTEHEAEQLGYSYSPAWWIKAYFCHEHTTEAERLTMLKYRVNVTDAQRLCEMPKADRARWITRLRQGTIHTPLRLSRPNRKTGRNTEPEQVDYDTVDLSKDDFPERGASLDQWSDCVAGRITYWMKQAEVKGGYRPDEVWPEVVNRVGRVV